MLQNKLKVSVKAVMMALISTVSVSAMAADATPKLPGAVWVIDDQATLMKLDPATPSDIQQSLEVTGLKEGDRLIGIDFRVAYGDLYGLANSGRLYIIDHSTGRARLIDDGQALPNQVFGPYGFDFNPAADKVRVVGERNHNRRLHPETGALVDYDAQRAGAQHDPDLAYDGEDQHAGKLPDIVAAAYTYNVRDSKLTTNYAIDRRLGMLVMQGSKEGVTPAVSPNLGVLYSVGSLGLGTLKDASMDISDIDNVALAALLSNDDERMKLYRLDLVTGHAEPLGVIGDGAHVAGLAIEP